jgi:hypothetical protein
LDSAANITVASLQQLSKQPALKSSTDDGIAIDSSPLHLKPHSPMIVICEFGTNEIVWRALHPLKQRQGMHITADGMQIDGSSSQPANTAFSISRRCESDPNETLRTERKKIDFRNLRPAKVATAIFRSFEPDSNVTSPRCGEPVNGYRRHSTKR